MNQLPILLAWDISDLLLPAIVVIFWVVGQLIGNRQQEAAPRPAQPRVVPDDLPKPKQDAAGKEIDAFLQQMAHRRGDERPAQVEVVAPARLRSSPLAVEPVEVEVVESRSAVDEGVAQHVRAHEFGGDIAEHVTHLGERVGQADEAMEEHLDQAFEHNVGQLRDTSSASGIPSTSTGRQSSRLLPLSQEAAAAATTPSRSRAGPSGLTAPDLAVLMQSPQDLRRAIVLYEILKRPES
jgi:hypothetical protein